MKSPFYFAIFISLIYTMIYLMLCLKNFKLHKLNPKYWLSPSNKNYIFKYTGKPTIHKIEKEFWKNIIVKQENPDTAITVLCTIDGYYTDNCEGGPLHVKSTHGRASDLKNTLFFERHFNDPTECFKNGWKLIPEYAVVHDGSDHVAFVSELFIGYKYHNKMKKDEMIKL